MMDYKYKPDGWLGIIVGTKLWIDFTERHKLDTSAEKLMKELGNRGKIVAQETVQGTRLNSSAESSLSVLMVMHLAALVTLL